MTSLDDADVAEPGCRCMTPDPWRLVCKSNLSLQDVRQLVPHIHKYSTDLAQAAPTEGQTDLAQTAPVEGQADPAQTAPVEGQTDLAQTAPTEDQSAPTEGQAQATPAVPAVAEQPSSGLKVVDLPQ